MPLVQPTRILILGAGGREHALAWRLAAEPGVNEVVVAPGSDGAAAEPRVRRAPVDPLDPEAVVALARQASAELVVVGPEAPLAAGVADALREAGIPVFGPTAAAARIETSKAFCHEIAAAAGVRMARARAFGPTEREAALRYAAELAAGPGVVVKADGLAGGKGVTVAADFAEAEAAIDRLFAAASPGDAPERPVLVLEERLVGREASVIALTDGETAVALPAARDHKRLLAGDCGPNTGGMGAYSPVPDLPDAAVSRILETVHRPILAELARRGTPFCGALYAGLILTADGPALLECNARFGDPEAQVILPRLAGALGPLLLAAARGELGAVLPRIGAVEGRLPTLPTAAVGFVLAAPGYPEAPRTGDLIAGLPAEPAADVLVFHAGTRLDAEGVFRTAGGRVLTVVGRGPDLAAARRAALRVAERIAWPGRQLRADIAAEFDASAGADAGADAGAGDGAGDGAGSPEGTDGAAPAATAVPSTGSPLTPDPAPSTSGRLEP
ncbi:MAG TPA: phosphoribosylamine--glycine ligase [Candidatus Binatia bacterium]|nr:phosphoribosylamine--glycine ligase [Candidatus Binatia bacterium]